MTAAAMARPDAGVAAGRFDDRPARSEPSLALGFLDHADTDAVLDRAAGVEHLQLGHDRRADPFGHAVEPDQGGMPECVDDVLADIARRGNGGCSHRVTPDRKNEEQARGCPGPGLMVARAFSRAAADRPAGVLYTAVAGRRDDD